MEAGGGVVALGAWAALCFFLRLVAAQRDGLMMLIGEQKAERECLRLECPSQTAGLPRRPLCASDGRTFASHCDLRRARCKDPLLSVAHRGRCKEMSRCQAERSHAQKQARRETRAVFIPECNADGSYSQVQCHNLTRYCWCVTPQGRPISGSSVEASTPQCTGGPPQRIRTNTHGKANDKSILDPLVHAPRLLESGGVWQDGDGDITRYPGRAGTAEERNRTGSEIREPTLLKSNIGKRSGRVGVPVKSTDSVLSHPHHHHHPHQPQDQQQQQQGASCELERKTALDLAQKRPGEDSFVPECGDGGQLFLPVQCYLSTGYCWCVFVDSGRPIPGSSKRDEPPICDGNARVRNEATDPFRGRPMQGCPAPKRAEFITSVLDALTTDMVSAINSSRGSRVPEPNPRHTLEERVVRWHFSRVDRDRDGAVSPGEARALRRLLRRRAAAPRRCARRFLDFCDLSGDRELSLAELTGCLGIATSAATSTSSSSSVLFLSSSSASSAAAAAASSSTGSSAHNGRLKTPIKRHGPNPLASFLV
ncbi:SPARC-related modular calcium-binding protein 2-like [Petromyzon marinus]|uniref:SPARC-related modular calcium-binding protein 2-like n=1 Tax=Petromyzon marinus TaxID=7757 RepID=UPI003F71F66B